MSRPRKSKDRDRPAPAAAPGPGVAESGPGWVAAAGIFLGLAVVYFLPAFLPGRQVYGTDYIAGGYPFHEFISRRFAEGGLPLWVPYVYGGLPLFANPGSTWHPFRFLADLLFPVSRIFPTIYVLQFALAGLGAYLLARELGARRWIALFAGVAFQFTGLTMSFVFAGHEGRIIVATMTPMVLFLLHRGIRTGHLTWFAGAALALGSALLSFQIQSSYYLLLLGLAWAIFALVRLRIRGAGRIGGRLALGFGAVAVAFAMAAVNFLPFLGYVDQSPRGEGGRGYEYATSWSMPPAEITGLAIPEHAGLLQQYQGENPFKYHTEYVGGAVILLALLGAWYNRRDRYWWFFAGAALVALTFSFGGHTPIYRLYYELLPGTRRFRAPSISFFVVSASLVMLAALALERLARLREEVASPSDPELRPATWIVAGVSALALLVLLAAGAAEGEHGRHFSAGALRFALVVWLAGGGIWLWLRRSVPTPPLLAGLVLLTLVDLWVVDRQFFETVEGPAYMYAADEVVEYLEEAASGHGTPAAGDGPGSADPGRDRIWVLPGAFQGGREYGGGLKTYLMYHGLDQLGGEHGNQLQRYNEFLGAGTATYTDLHNVLGDLQMLVQNPGAPPRPPSFLATGNIRYLIALGEIPGLRPVFAGRTGIVHEVPGVLPRAYLAAETVVAAQPDGALEVLADPAFDPATTAVLYEPLAAPLPGGELEGDVVIERYEPDRVVVATRASRDALLVLADNYYGAWQVEVDGEPAELVRANHTFRGVRVPAGEHRVEFAFRPSGVFVGLGLSIGALLLALLAVAVDLTVRRRRRSDAAAVA